MFDIGFWEIILISIIGLVVLGPERLPVAIRTVRSWISGVRNFSNTVKSELTEELRIHELHNDLKQAEQQNMDNLSPDIAASVRSLKEAAALVTKPYEKPHKAEEEKNKEEDIELNTDNLTTQQPGSVVRQTKPKIKQKNK